MKYGVHLPNFGLFQDAKVLAEWAREAEQAGWDGFFIWDHVLYDPSWHPLVDPWIGLTAVVLATQNLQCGTLVTPIARRRPWKLARELTSLERLSQGRLILGVGLGDPVKWEYEFFHEDPDPRIRAEKTDEGLAILKGLWTGQPFSFQGKHYQLDEMVYNPTPTRSIPIWIGGAWPRKKPMQRAARYDGVIPMKLDSPMTPQDWRDLLAYIQQHRTTDTPFEAIAGGVLPDNSSASLDRVSQFAEAGATWWLEDISPARWHGWDWRGWLLPWDEAALLDRVRMGPPRIE